MAPSPEPVESEKAVPSFATNIEHKRGCPATSREIHVHGTHTVSNKSNITEEPIERLLNAVKSISPIALSASLTEMESVLSLSDKIATSAAGNGCRAPIGKDVAALAKCRLQARNFNTKNGRSGIKKMKRYPTAMPLNVVSSTGSVNEITNSKSSVAIEANHALLEEIKEINQRLIDTVVNICDEDVDPNAAAAIVVGEGTIVKCCFSPVALSSDMRSHYMSQIQPLCLLVPTNYPNCSPMLLDRFPVQVRKQKEELWVKAKCKLSLSLRTLTQPMSVGEIATTWDICARAVISEYAQAAGGGTFSSKYGTLETCSIAE